MRLSGTIFGLNPKALALPMNSALKDPFEMVSQGGCDFIVIYSLAGLGPSDIWARLGVVCGSSLTDMIFPISGRLIG